jgi:hypothetical protein
MGIPYWTVMSGATPITNVQAVTVAKGLRVLTDNYTAGRVIITGRRPDLLPTLNIGQTIDCTLTNPNSSPASTYFTSGRIADFQVNYGTVAAMDTWTLELEDAFSVLGRSKITRTWAAGTTTLTAFNNVCTDTGITGSSIGSSTKTLSATTVTAESALAVMQNIINTEQGLMYAAGNDLFFYTTGWQSSTTFYAFSDAGGAATKYQSVQFLSMADNYSTYVLVTIDGGTPTVVGSGLYAYQEDTYAADAAAATDIGNYILGALSVQTSTPNRLTVFLNDETSNRALQALQINTGVALTLRGQTYNANIIGYTITSDTERTLITYNLASSAFYNFLILNNSVYGKLDSNRLGF